MKDMSKYTEVFIHKVLYLFFIHCSLHTVVKYIRLSCNSQIGLISKVQPLMYLQPPILQYLQKNICPYTTPVQFSFFSSTGRRPASYCHGVGTSCVRPSVRSSVRASVNFFFKKLLLRNY